MARVTVEDCVDKVPNRFQLVMLAAQRARELSVGAQITVDRDNDKNPVVALREIAEATVKVDDLEDEIIKGMQRQADTDDPEEETTDLLAMEEELSATADTFGTPLSMAEDDEEDAFEDTDPDNTQPDDEVDRPEE